MKSLVSTGIALLLLCTSLYAQTFQECADVDESGSINIGDLAHTIDAFMGGPAVPSGRGDIDFRQNFNLGDSRYLCGYLFHGYPQGGCPPFADYTLLTPPDTVYLPEIIVPAGSGTIVAPIRFSCAEPVTDLLLTCRLAGTNASATIPSIEFVNWNAPLSTWRAQADEVTIVMWALQNSEVLPAGSRPIAAVQFNYSSAMGGTLRLEPFVYNAYRFSHQVYGSTSLSDYNQLKIGLPQVVIAPAAAMANMVVAPDSLYFVALSGSGDPAPQTFEVLTDSSPFIWTATAPTWIELSPTSGVSGASVSVQPRTTGLTAGVHTGTIAVSSPSTVNSPQNVLVVLRLQPQYPAFDANCDGIFNIADIVYLVQYIFGGPTPYDPCLGK